MIAKLFLHGVPDSPAIWAPLINALDLGDTVVSVPALPGFTAPLPVGFKPTKDGYAAWAMGEAEALHAAHGPIDVVGHDWGALIAQRIVMLRPELFRSFALSNAAIDPDYRGHRLARIWNRRISGELFMWLTHPAALGKSLVEQGVPADIATETAEQWASKDKRRAILTLYRSAKGLNLSTDWGTAQALAVLRGPGVLIWGENDPYVGIDVGERVAARHGIALQRIEAAGHWAIAERPNEVAAALNSFWATL